MWRYALWVVGAGCGRVDFSAATASGSDATADADPDSLAPSVSLVQASQSMLFSGSAPSTSLTFDIAPGAGHLVWVTVVTADVSALTGVVDNQGNVYTSAVAQVSTGACGPIGIWGYVARNVASSGPFTITVQGGNTWGIHLREYIVGATAQLRVQSSSTGTGATSDSGPVTTTGHGALMIAAQTHCEMSTTGAGPGWQNHVISTENQAFEGFSTEDWIAPPSGTYDGTFTHTPAETDGWAVGVAVIADD